MSSTSPTLTRRAEPAQTPGTSSYLFLVLRCDRPLTSSIRLCLRGAQIVKLGRGGDGIASRIEEVSSGQFELGVPDPWMSSSHAVLQKMLGTWIIEDAKSKNGTLVNGRLTQRAELSDGDLIELGHTFFIFRKALAVTRGGPPVISAGQLYPPAPGLATLVPALGQELAKVEAVAPSPVSVVIHGESGTGKEVIASAIHALSGRPGPFVAVNCAALPTTLVESELFGYRKGAFSGATEDRPGLIRTASSGTLFLDEIGDLSPAAQAVLLRVLQEGEVLPIGATRPVKVDIRLLAATHRDLQALVAENQFRADLMARICGLTLALPPLRERREDLGTLLSTLLRRHFSERAEQINFTPEAARAVLRHSWPLNVRELEKSVCAAVVLAKGESVQLPQFPESVRASAETERKDAAAVVSSIADSSAESSELSEEDKRRREQIIGLLREHAGNVTSVARALEKRRTQVQRWLKRYRIDSRDFRR